MAYKIVHAGPKSQLGGAQNGFISCEYQSYVFILVIISKMPLARNCHKIGRRRGNKLTTYKLARRFGKNTNRFGGNLAVAGGNSLHTPLPSVLRRLLGHWRGQTRTLRRVTISSFSTAIAVQRFALSAANYFLLSSSLHFLHNTLLENT